MLNYLSAELYKLRRKKSLYIGIAALLVLESLLFTPSLWIDEMPLAEILMGFFTTALPCGLFLAPVFAVLAFDNQHGYATLKNEVVFGIPRSRVYLGKLLAGMTAGTVAAAVVIGWYLLLCMLTAGPIAESPFWTELLIDIISAWLTWLAALSFAMFLLFGMGSSAGAMVVTYLIAFIGVPVGMIGAGEGAAPWIRLLVNLFYSAPYKRFWYDLGGNVNDTSPLHWDALSYAVLVCAVWVGIFTALGLLRLRRREIK